MHFYLLTFFFFLLFVLFVVKQISYASFLNKDPTTFIAPRTAYQQLSIIAKAMAAASIRHPIPQEVQKVLAG